jgi:hypothetical protein
MTRRRIFLLREGDELRELVEESYTAEVDLQELLARYPNLLPGDQMNEDHPRRWLLVSREASVPDREEGAGRWSLDHLFLDQEGVPTLVEVKRSSDTRIRREVVGQMLDYAANGLAYWPIEKIRALYEAECAERGLDPEERLRELLEGDEADLDEFWQQVKTNLQAGRIRMLFVADEIPPELRRVVEFLNGQMDPAEVLAVAVRQYVGDGLRTLVPQVHGQTAESQIRKGAAGSRPSRQWDEGSFFAELAERNDEATVRGARRVYEWGRRIATRFWWGQGARSGSCFPVVMARGIQHSPFALWTNGPLELQFQHMANGQKPFDQIERRRELLQRLNRVPGVDLPDDAHSRRPGIPLRLFDSDEVWAEFEKVMDWYLHQIGAEPATAEERGGDTATVPIREMRGRFPGIDTTVERDDDRV